MLDNSKYSLVHTIQKQFGRCILNIKDTRSIPTIEVFKRLNWLPVDEAVKFHTPILMYKSVNNQAPIYLCEKFRRHKEVSSRTTRASARGDLYTGADFYAFKIVKYALKID